MPDSLVFILEVWSGPGEIEVINKTDMRWGGSRPHANKQMGMQFMKWRGRSEGQGSRKSSPEKGALWGVPGIRRGEGAGDGVRSLGFEKDFSFYSERREAVRRCSGMTLSLCGHL